MNINQLNRINRLKAARAIGTHTESEWLALLEEVNGRCVRCGNFGIKLTKDHIVTITMGGSDAIENIQPLCRSCNSAKTYEDFNWFLHRREHGWSDCEVLGQLRYGDYQSKLISLWEIMKAFNHSRFQGASWVLGYTQGVFSANPNYASELVNSEAQAEFARQLRRVCEEIGTLELPVTFAQLSESVSTLEKGRVSAGKMADMAEGIADTLRREMKSKKLFRLSGATQQYFDTKDAFGEAVAEAFPSAEYDIAEAGNCLALGRGTACVYHSMGVLEHGLKALASEFNAPTNHRAWGQIIKQIEDGIAQIPRNPNKPNDWREHQQFCSEAASQFRHFKSAWRDYTAHARVKYTEDEAEAIYRHVGDFMKQISKRLREPTP